jgi:tetratricopeptide (TPR) repeat protein
MISDSAPSPGHPESRFSTWLLRPYLDLGPFRKGPLHARAVEECWNAFVDPALRAFAPQRVLPHGFRAQLAAELANSQYAVTAPGDLPEGLRTDRWRQLCDALADWSSLPDARKCRLVMLMHCLCFYGPLLTLIPKPLGNAAAEDPHWVEMAFWRAFAEYMLGMRTSPSDYVDADLSAFEHIARLPEAGPTAFNAAVRVFVHKAKTGSSEAALAKCADMAERALSNAVGRLDDFAAGLMTSRYYRALGFLPQRRGDRAEVARVMDLAERHALAIRPASAAQEHLHGENLYALMESRTKEALWLGDLELALFRVTALVRLDPCDSRALVELGEVRMKRKEWEGAAQAYLKAAVLGPPASAIARHLAGVCFRELGQEALAAFLFKETLEIDPLGISPRDEIHNLPPDPVFSILKDWSLSTLRL